MGLFTGKGRACLDNPIVIASLSKLKKNQCLQCFHKRHQECLDLDKEGNQNRIN